MTERVTDLVSVLQRIEEEAESIVRDGRLFAYARDLARLVSWLRTQPRSRVLLLAALGAGVMAGVVVLLGTINRPLDPGLEESGLEGHWPDPDPDWG